MKLISYSFKRLGITIDVPNIYNLTYTILMQVKKGKITTYGDIAKLLGDKIASRAIGKLMAVNKYPDIIPCYKVVHSDGRIGKYSAPGGEEKKAEKLRKEGIIVSDKKILEFDNQRQIIDEIKMFPYLKSLKRIQSYLSQRIKLDKEVDFNEVSYFAATDTSYIDYYPDIAIGAAVLYEMTPDRGIKILSASLSVIPTYFPYIPTYLAFREAPSLLLAIEALINDTDVDPDLYLFDGHGVLHPRGFGIASHMGLLLNKPSIGIAKSRLIGETCEERKTVGKFFYQKVKIDDIKRFGYKVGVKNMENKAIYISPGNIINHESTLKFVLNTSWSNGKYVIMDLPHRMVKNFSKSLKHFVLKEA